MFFWCHIRHLNLVETNPQRITKEGKEMISKLDYGELNFLFQKNIIVELKVKTIFVLMCFVIKMD